MRTRKRQIAKAGIFGSIENPTLVKANDLKEIAETFPDIKKAPIKLCNHWSDNKPRLGNVVKVEYNDKEQALYAEVEEHDTLADSVDQGYFPDVSIGARARASDGKMYLHHLAYLGDEPPAIKDLVNDIQEDLNKAEENTDIAASDSDKDVVTYPSVNTKKLYLSDTAIKSKEVQTMTEQEIKALQEENARLKKENEEKETLLSDSLAKAKAKAKEELAKAAEGKVTQPQMEQLMNLADSFQDDKTIELSDGATKKPVEVLTDIFASMKPKVEEGTINLSDSDNIGSAETLDFNVI